MSCPRRPFPLKLHARALRGRRALRSSTTHRSPLSHDYASFGFVTTIAQPRAWFQIPRIHFYWVSVPSGRNAARDSLQAHVQIARKAKEEQQTALACLAFVRPFPAQRIHRCALMKAAGADDSQIRVKTPWSLPVSVFKPRMKDSDAKDFYDDNSLLNKMFIRDWEWLEKKDKFIGMLHRENKSNPAKLSPEEVRAPAVLPRGTLRTARKRVLEILQDEPLANWSTAEGGCNMSGSTVRWLRTREPLLLPCLE